ncbi:glycoside hydrolase family 3 N-terminal domain-containing protein [Sinomonas sp. JGH33]|uniref:Glycoside hydrolase family 3 N-terminal domain-containing protein n=1 Tax=Sinomonas terricola TaxID=3110330 RepID=A0ABU5T5S5_9MICC|nr:glycoside hydrolase family 3 N-terminal domain-containing protein [Sinomonas sp. JGH33]MEA5455025.1 glycoside hydrolase family 3 N-terminal domain-containing protein [Sinomonas sp. JGH33]
MTTNASLSEATDDVVERLVREMTFEEKLAQLVGVWVNASTDGNDVAPLQSQLVGEARTWEEIVAHGLGQITRMYGTKPLEPEAGARALAAAQRQITAASRFGIPAQVHEECLAGLAAWKATAFPVPLAWGASFNPEIVRRMAGRIGSTMRSLGVHQGLAPVLDVVRDLRWGRVEETIGEDPYLVGTIGAAYVQGLEAAGIVATLKHFVGYSASRAGRNHAPVSMGQRELADVMLPPFEMALRRGGARSVMHAYTEIDGVPSAANTALLTSLLRDAWGFDGTVVADYFGIAFLHLTHRVAGGPAAAAGLALRAGVDVELPTVNCYGEPLRQAVLDGSVPEELVDRALRRVLTQKQQLGLLDPTFDPEPPCLRGNPIELDPVENRALARELAAQSLVLLKNGPRGEAPVLPLTGHGTVGIVGPLAVDSFAMLGCYSFDAHVGATHPDVPLGVRIPTVGGVAVERLGQARTVPTGTCEQIDDDEIDQACAVARSVDTCVVVVGDTAGLFGRGTSGEGNDAADLTLPGRQQQLLDAVLAAAKDAGSATVVVVLSGRPYALGAVEGQADAIIQGFFPGEEGAEALWDVLLGQANPSGRLPVSIPRSSGGQPGTYLHTQLAGKTGVSALDPTPLYPFGHGLGYSRFEFGDHACSAAAISTSGAATVALTVTNAGPFDGAEVVQLYAEMPVAEVTRPLRELIGYARVELAVGESSRVEFAVHADRFSFTGLDLARVVVPGEVRLHMARSSDVSEHIHTLTVEGPRRQVGIERELLTAVRVTRRP